MIAKSFIRNAWYVVGFSEEFPVDKLHGQVIARKPIVLWRGRSGKVVAFDNRCVHKRMPLSEGRIRANGQVECAYHGLCYDEAGACTSIPSHPEGPIPEQAKLKPYPVLEQDGLVWIWPGDASLSTDVRPPRVPEIANKEWDSIGSKPIPVPANYFLLIENLLDITHFYPLHDGNVGDIENSKIPIEMEEGTVEGNQFVRTVRKTANYKQPPLLLDWFGFPIVDRLHTHCMMSPAITRVEMRVAPPGKLGTEAEKAYVLFHTHTPVDETNHIWRWRATCKSSHRSGGNPSISVAQRMVEKFDDVVAQDLWVLEKQQQMFAFPDDGYTELYLKPDKALRRARQIFSTLERAEAGSAESRSAAAE